MDYLGVPVVIMLCGLLLAPSLAIFLIVKLVRKNRKANIGYLPVIVMIPVLILLVLWGGPVLTQVGDLMLPGESVIRTTAGEIDSIEPGPKGSWHYLDGKFVTGQMLSIEDQRYYVISENQLEEGMVISLTYSHSENGNVILSWQKTTVEEAARIRAESAAFQPELSEKKQREVTTGQRQLGLWLSRIGMTGAFVFVGLTVLFREKIIFKILINDAQVRGGIRFSFPNILPVLLPMGCILLLWIGSGISSGESHAWFMTLLAVCLLAGIIGTECSTSLILDGQVIIIRRYRKERQYHLSDVRTVFWRKHRGFIGKSMVLVMHDGTSYWFNMDTFVGVQNMYHILSAETEEQT